MQKFQRLAYHLVTLYLLIIGLPAWAQSELTPEPTRPTQPPTDWLLEQSPYQAEVYQGEHPNEIALSNGLIRRTFRLAPNAATVRFDNLMTGETLLRGVKPEAELTLNGVDYAVGGLKGQPNYAFLNPDWVDQMTADSAAWQFTGYAVSEPQAPFEWKRVRHHAEGLDWPPKGVHLRMDYRMPSAKELTQSGQILPSDYRRRKLLESDFNTLDSGWTTITSRAHARSSFGNEGKVGEIYTPENTSVFVEHTLPDGTALVEASLDVGTDHSQGWGPGIALIWPQKTIKFYLRPGENADDEGVATFGLWDGKEEHPVAGGQQQRDVSLPWTLRLRWDDEWLYCEAKPGGGKWQVVEKLPASDQPPRSVRIGKMNPRGLAEDQEGAVGDLVRLHLYRFAAYSNVDDSQVTPSNRQTESNVQLSVHYELYDGIPVMAKWFTLKNASSQPVLLDHFTTEIMAAVEHSSMVETGQQLPPSPNIHVETDYAFSSFDAQDANQHVVHWVPDPDYQTQVNYLRLTPCLLRVAPEVGPAQRIAPGGRFTTFRTFILPHDSYERERQGLAQRRMYRTLAPWTTENPLMMHARFADWERVKTAIDQAAEAGFEMVILTFGSGFTIEDDSPAYLAKMKEYADYASSKGIEIGGYSLLASRRIGDGQDVVMPEGQKPTFGNSPCIGSEWGQKYFQKLYQFYEKTGFMLLEHDGSYPGDVCVSEDHPGHRGYQDSRWNQYQTIAAFYRWCRSQGIYLNVPDYYYLAGSNKCGMGYREVNWSLPRSQQLIHTRQNIYDGAWNKQSSMGWMFVPLTEYHGGGAAATIEPLNEHLNHYQNMITSNLGGGVQACYRGPRLYDTERTKAMVQHWVGWYKKYREVLEGDIIHLRRADGREPDYWLNVNPRGEEKGLLSVYNPLSETVRREIYVPLYYTGLTEQAMVSHEDEQAVAYPLNREYGIRLEVEIPPQAFTWYVIR